MKKVLAVAFTAPLLLIGAALPDAAMDSASAPAQAAATPARYQPCRPGPGDDRCIQLYERGVRASYARWLRDDGATGRATQVAMGGPVEPRGRRPPRQASAENCVNPTDQSGEARGM